MALAVKVAFWDMRCHVIRYIRTDILEDCALSIFMVHYSTLKIQVLFSFETLVSIPEDVNLHFIRILPCTHVCIARFNPWPRYRCYVYMYEGNSKSKVPYFIPAEMITASSWQAWVLVVHLFTTI